MATNFILLKKGLKKLAVLLLLLIISPVLLSMAFKSIRIYDEGNAYIFSIIFLVISAFLMLFTVFYAFSTFKTILASLFENS